MSDNIRTDQTGRSLPQLDEGKRAAPSRCTSFLVSDLVLKWSRLFGQFGGEVKLIPGFDHAAKWSVFAGGASPASCCILFAP